MRTAGNILYTPPLTELFPLTDILWQGLALMEAPFVKKTEISVGQHLKEQVSVIGENIQVTPGSGYYSDDISLLLSCLSVSCCSDRQARVHQIVTMVCTQIRRFERFVLGEAIEEQASIEEQPQPAA